MEFYKCNCSDQHFLEAKNRWPKYMDIDIENVTNVAYRIILENI